MTLKEAFYSSLQERGVYKKIGLDKSTVSHIKSKMRYGDFPSEATMKDILGKLGYIISQPESWEKILN
jgi:hypothetical protein